MITRVHRIELHLQLLIDIGEVISLTGGAALGPLLIQSDQDNVSIVEELVILLEIALIVLGNSLYSSAVVKLNVAFTFIYICLLFDHYYY